MKKFLLILVMFTFANYAHASKIYNNTLSLGVTGSTANKDINFGQTPNGVLRWNHGSNKFQFSNNGGSNFYDFQQYIDNLVSGRLVFGSATGTLGQSSNLVWDNVNNRLGINTSPTYDLDVNGTINFVNLRGGSDNILVDSTGFWAKNQKEVKFFEQNGNGSSYMGFKAPADLTTTTNFTLPNGDGNPNQALVTDGSGTLRWGDSGGGLGTNYITNANAEVNTTGWATYADAAGTSPVDGISGAAGITWTRVTSPILSGVASFKYTKDAANRQGNGVSYDYTVTSAHNAEAQIIRMYYQTDTNYVEDCLGVWVYDKTNSVLISTTPYLIKKSSLVEHPFFEFQNSASATDYRFIIHNICTSATAFNVYFDDVQIGPKQSSIHASNTDTYDAVPSATPANATRQWAKYRRDGEGIWFDVCWSYTGAGSFTINYNEVLPAGVSLDTTKLLFASGSGIAAAIGSSYLFDSGIDNKVYDFELQSSYIYLRGLSGSGSAITSGDRINIKGYLPITGWSSGKQVADIYTGRDISGRFYRSGNQTVADTITTKVLFNTTTFDSVFAFDSVNNRYICKVAGKYKINSSIFISDVDPTSTVGKYLQTNIYKNGSDYSLGDVYSFESTVANQYATLRNQDTLILAVNDYIEIFVTNTSGATMTIDGSTLARTFLNIELAQSPSQVLASEKVIEKWSSNTGSYSTGATILFEDKQTSSHGAYNPATGIFTAPKSGILKASSKILVNTSSTAFSVLAIRNSGGSVLALGSYTTNLGSSNAHSPTVIFNGYVNQGDTFKITYTHTIGGSVAVDTSDTVGQYNSVEFIME